MCNKGPHGVGVRGKQRSILLPECGELDIQNHVHFVTLPQTLVGPVKFPRSTHSQGQSLAANATGITFPTGLIYI